MQINLTKSQCESLVDFITLNLLDVIRKDKEDGLDYLLKVSDILDAMRVLQVAMLFYETEE